MKEALSKEDVYRAAVVRCRTVLLVVAAVTLCMVGAAYAPLAEPGLRTGLILAAAGFNAFLVAGHLMHLLQERNVIYSLLAFTVLFFAALMGLCIWAHGDTPAPGGV
ncbi:hypothetical protein [Limisphaera sp. VF-2]|jgi:hypothetical protein|uniref:hypothetical protein n=1 Tax=Limisphaera sp. VF-2 TaxID=3400418 RepID=UPI00175CFAD7|nr:hypothetical protein [Limisphaera sp.]